MKPHGKKITLFLMDGTASRRISAELSNWTGRAYKIPRTMIKESRDRFELKSAGIYLLFGKDPEHEDQDSVYIGEAENLLDRLHQHLHKEFWIESISVNSKDGNLNKAHVKYLEGRLYELAGQARRYHIMNASIPARTSLSEADVAEMEEFLENLILMVHSLGYKVFESRTAGPDKKNYRELKLEGVRGAQARGYLSEEGFVVSKGSLASADTTPSMETRAPYYLKIRQRLIQDGTLLFKDNQYEFTCDQVFTSPSSAASIILGRSANGRVEWKTKEGKTLEEYESPES